MQANTEFNKGTVTYNIDPQDLKQDYYIQSFDNVGELLDSVIKLIEFNKELLNTLSTANKNKVPSLDFDALLKGVVDMKTRHMDYTSQIQEMVENKVVSPVEHKTAEQIAKENEKLLAKLEKAEKKALK